MDNLIQGIRNVVVYMDDILITGKADEQHLKTLEEVLGRLKKAGMWANKAKRSFMVKSVICLTDQVAPKI